MDGLDNLFNSGVDCKIVTLLVFRNGFSYWFIHVSWKIWLSLTFSCADEFVCIWFFVKNLSLMNAKLWYKTKPCILHSIRPWLSLTKAIPDISVWLLSRGQYYCNWLSHKNGKRNVCSLLLYIATVSRIKLGHNIAQIYVLSAACMAQSHP